MRVGVEYGLVEDAVEDDMDAFPAAWTEFSWRIIYPVPSTGHAKGTASVRDYCRETSSKSGLRQFGRNARPLRR